MSYRFDNSLWAGSGWNCCSILILLASCQQTCMTYTTAVCTVKTPDDGQRNCLKHVEFHSKDKFEKLVHLFGFIIRYLTQCAVTWTSNLWSFMCSRSLFQWNSNNYLHFQNRLLLMNPFWDIWICQHLDTLFLNKYFNTTLLSVFWSHK
jgi:hypothetical protein